MLFLGEKTVVDEKEVIGIFDLENTSVQKNTRLFLEKAQKAGKVEVVCTDIPKSFVITGRKNDWKMWLTQVATTTLEKRHREGFSEIKNNLIY